MTCPPPSGPVASCLRSGCPMSFRTWERRLLTPAPVPTHLRGVPHRFSRVPHVLLDMGEAIVEPHARAHASSRGAPSLQRWGTDDRRASRRSRSVAPRLVRGELPRGGAPSLQRWGTDDRWTNPRPWVRSLADIGAGRPGNRWPGDATTVLPTTYAISGIFPVLRARGFVSKYRFSTTRSRRPVRAVSVFV